MVDDKRETSLKPLTEAPEQLSWGEPPLPLLPASLAVRLAGIPLPEWLTEILDAPGASVTALKAGIWDRLPDDPPVRDRARAYVLDLVRGSTIELHDVTIGGSGISSFEALVAGWPARPRNALLRAGVGREASRLATLTFGELLDGRQIGVKTALEAAAFLEVYLPRAAPEPDCRASPVDPPAHDSAVGGAGITAAPGHAAAGARR